MLVELKERHRLSERESEELIVKHAPLVKAIAQSLLRRLPDSVEFDDLVQDGYIGLLGAIIQSTKEHAGSHVQQYLAQRIRGAMLDGLRDNDPGTRRIRRSMRDVEKTIHELGHRLGRAPSETEIAAAMGMSLADYQRLLQDAHGYTLFSIEDFDDNGSAAGYLEWCVNTASDPVAALERRVLQRRLLIAISDLTVREEEVMIMLYVEDLTMRRVGEHLGLSEGRISQIHSQAIAKLRAAVIGVDDQPNLLKPRRRSAA